MRNYFRLSAVLVGSIIATMLLFGAATSERGPHAAAVEIAMTPGPGSAAGDQGSAAF